jgi:hypothetical protein
MNMMECGMGGGLVHEEAFFFFVGFLVVSRGAFFSVVFGGPFSGISLRGVSLWRYFVFVFVFLVLFFFLFPFSFFFSPITSPRTVFCPFFSRFFFLHPLAIGDWLLVTIGYYLAPASSRRSPQGFLPLSGFYSSGNEISERGGGGSFKGERGRFGMYEYDY